MMKLIKRAYDGLWKRLLAENASSDFDHDKFLEVANQTLVKTGLQPLPLPPSDACRHKYFFSDYCRRRCLDGSNYCFWHHRSVDKYDATVVTGYFGKNVTLREALEMEVSSGATLSGAYLQGAQLGGDWFRPGADLHCADLRDANLRNAHLSYSNLREANLTRADLAGAYLSDADLHATVMTDAALFDTKFRNNNFDSVRGLSKECFRGPGVIPRHRMLEKYPDQAEPMYRALASYFARLGVLDDASWAAYRNRLMRHAVLREKLNLNRNIWEAVVKRSLSNTAPDIREAVEVGFTTWLSAIKEFTLSFVYRWCSGYGEKPLRVGILSAILIFLYAAIYVAAGALSEPTYRAALYFSIVTFTTLGYGDITPAPQFRLLAASEALIGLLFTGLFLFPLSRRSVGRA